MCTINWCGFTWEAAAILISGLAAVAGAIVIGLRQTQILAAQTELELMKFRAELFDKRYRVFVEFAVFLDEAAVPSSTLNSIMEATRQNVERSIFLFDKDLYDVLSQLFEKGQIQLISPNAVRSKELLQARTELYLHFEKYLKLREPSDTTRPIVG